VRGCEGGGKGVRRGRGSDGGIGREGDKGRGRERESEAVTHGVGA